MTSANPETIIIPTDAANKAFDDESLTGWSARESIYIPGFHHMNTYGDIREARNGRYAALFIITRMSDGKMFATPYTEAADDNFAAENPFHSPDNKTEFREIIKTTRTIIEERYEFA